MANRQEIDLGVNMSPTEDGLNKASDAADKLTDRLDKASDAAGAVVDSVAAIGPAAAGSAKDLTGLSDMLNDFLVRRAAVTGKMPKLFDAGADVAALENIRAAFEQLVKDTKSLPNGLGNKLGVTGQAGVGSPEKVNFDKLDSSAKEQQRLKDNMILSLLRRAQGKGAFDLGLTASELQGRVPTPPVEEPGDKPRRRRRGEAPEPDEERSKRGPMANAARHLASRITAGSGAAGEAARAASGGAEAGMLGALPGGLLGGAALGIAGFGLFKAAQGVDAGMDRAKDEAVEVDRFKRAIGDLGEGFNMLKERTRTVGDGFSLTYEQSRKLSIEFARAALYRDSANPRQVDGQARAAIGMAQAFGIDESQGVQAIGSLRHDRSIGETQRDARMFGVQVAEALKRTGSTLNAPDVLQAIMAFSRDTASRSLTAANVGEYAGMVSSMAGSGTPGLDARNAASIIGKADSVFRAGGGMGEASKTFQYMALGGNELGPALTAALQETGLFGTRSRAFGGENNQVAKFFKNEGVDISGIKGDETNIKRLMDFVDANTPKGEPGLKLQALQGLTSLNPQQAATIYNLRDTGKLDETMKLADSAGVDMDKLSATGYDKLAELAVNRKTPESLQSFRGELLNRTDLNEQQKKQLGELGSVSDPDKLRTGLAQVVGTLERERNLGQQIQENTANTSNQVQKLSEGLLPATQKMREYLGALVAKLAPDSPEAKALLEEKKLDTRRDAETGKLPEAKVAEKNEAYRRKFEENAVRIDIPGAEKQRRALKILEEGRSELGEQFVEPGPVKYPDSGRSFDVPQADRDKARGKVDANYARHSAEQGLSPATGSGNPMGSYKFFRSKGWSHEQASGLVANLTAESGINPKSVGDGGEALGIAQWHPDRQAEFAKRYGHPMTSSTLEEQQDFVHFELTEGQEKKAGDKLRGTKTAYEAGAAVSRWYERPGATNQEIGNRGRLAETMAAKFPAERSQPADAASAKMPAERTLPADPASVKIPAGDPLAKQEERKSAAQAERMRHTFEFSPIAIQADVNLRNPATGDTQSVSVKSTVGKPVPSGATTGTW